jgi:hypothetical protein
MASIISAGTTDSTSLNISGDKTGILQLASNNAVTAVTIDTSQNATFAGSVKTNTLTSAASTALTLQSAGTTAVTISTAQNVGIGTTTPNAKLDITEAVTSTIGSSLGLNIQNNDSRNAGELIQIGMGNVSPSKPMTVIGTVVNTASFYGNGDIFFATRSVTTDTAPTERMRIGSNGTLTLNNTSGSGVASFFQNSSGQGSYNIYIRNTYSGDVGNPALYLAKYDNNTTTSQIFVRFSVNNEGVTQGQINANGANAAAFGSWSDERLKENIVELPSQLANIMALRPVEFDYIESAGGGHQIGFIAQEVKEVYPDVVGEDTDGMLTLSDMNKNDARLIKCIQEMKALIDTQAETINALTARIVALEGK